MASIDVPSACWIRVGIYVFFELCGKPCEHHKPTLRQKDAKHATPTSIQSIVAYLNIRVHSQHGRLPIARAFPP